MTGRQPLSNDSGDFLDLAEEAFAILKLAHPQLLTAALERSKDSSGALANSFLVAVEDGLSHPQLAVKRATVKVLSLLKEDKALLTVCDGALIAYAAQEEDEVYRILALSLRQSSERSGFDGFIDEVLNVSLGSTSTGIAAYYVLQQTQEAGDRRVDAPMANRMLAEFRGTESDEIRKLISTILRAVEPEVGLTIAPGLLSTLIDPTREEESRYDAGGIIRDWTSSWRKSQAFGELQSHIAQVYPTCLESMKRSPQSVSDSMAAILISSIVATKDDALWLAEGCKDESLLASCIGGLVRYAPQYTAEDLPKLEEILTRADRKGGELLDYSVDYFYKCAAKQLSRLDDVRIKP